MRPLWMLVFAAASASPAAAQECSATAMICGGNLAGASAASVPTAAGASVTPPGAAGAAASGPRSVNWGQNDPAVLHTIFGKVAQGAKSEKFAQDNRSWFGKLVNSEPSVETKLVLSEDYTVKQSPAAGGVDDEGNPIVHVGKSALEMTRSEGEMAFILGHELQHTLVQKKKAECVRRGVKANNGQQYIALYSPEMKRYQNDLEKEADSWGQRYMINAGYGAGDSVSAIGSMCDLLMALGVDMSKDKDHASCDERAQALQNFGGPRFEAKCPWPEDK